MSRRQIQIVALLLTAFTVGETMLSVLALGHRHSDATNHAAALHAGKSCSHGHGHAHALPVQDATAPDESNDSQRSSESSCSICRYLAQPVLNVTWALDFSQQDLVEVVLPRTSFDVASPAHLIPQPRSPPAVV